MMKKKHKKKDPFQKREAQNYENPVASREFILSYMEELGRPASLQNLFEAMEVQTPELQEGLRRRLQAMVRDGQLISNRRGSYALVSELSLVRGRVVGHRDGFGFVVSDQGGPDIFLPARQMRVVFPDDIVLVRVGELDRRGRAEGCIVDVLERNTTQIVGRFFEESGVCFINPDNKNIAHDILIPAQETHQAKPGQIVLVEITSQPSERMQPLGRVVKILGDYLTPGMEMELATRSHNIPVAWPAEVLAEVQRLEALSNAPMDLTKRKDLRSLPFVTIDGEDAKDFDDAVFCKRGRDGWSLTVAIADVGHYLQPESALDQEARKRGTSVYFAAKVVPMLPEILSNHWCSLLPHQDRLVVVCELQLTAAGEVKKYQFSEAVIHSHARLTYTQVAHLLEQDHPVETPYWDSLVEFKKIFEALLEQRQARGALDIDSTETKILFDEEGKIKSIVPVTRLFSHRMIEEAMLLANVAAADYLSKAKIPVLYRNHELPDLEKTEKLKNFLRAFGLRLGGGERPSTLQYSRLLQRVKGRKDAHLLQTMVLRSLKQAVYSPENIGHFGLGYPAYCHFTSPIRRYPDLLTHRAVKYLLGRGKVANFPYTVQQFQEWGEHCSVSERRADLATRDATDWLKCFYMKDKVGDIFHGRICDVTGFGVFVELDAIYVQGLLHVTALKNDYYVFDDLGHQLCGRNSGKVYRLGDPIVVSLSRVDVDSRSIDFDLA